MGGSSKKQKVGNKYYKGFVLVPCRQIDVILEIEASKKSIWKGQKSNGQISINKPNAFGGDEREGGFTGSIDIQRGDLDQPVNDYLSAAIEGLMPAFRGVVTYVFRRPYVSANTGRLPSIRTKQVNVKGIHRNWLPEKAIVEQNFIIEGVKIFIVMDMSILMSPNSFAIQKTAIAGFIRNMKGSTNSVRIVCNQPFLGSSEIERFNCDDEDYEEIAIFVESRTRNGFNSQINQANISTAPDFFNSDGENESFKTSLLNGQSLFGNDNIPLLQRLTGVKQENDDRELRHIIIVNGGGFIDLDGINSVISNLPLTNISCFGLLNAQNEFDTTKLSQIDNTDLDEVPTTDDAEFLQLSIERIFIDWVDMNPAHIIRCFWTDPMRGGTVSDEDIGESFATEADRYISEKMGFSPKFRGIDQADADRKDLERHVDAFSYRSNVTGKIELTSVRDNYTIGDLIILDSTIVTDWSGLSRPSKSEIPNQLTVTYTRRDGKQGSVTRTNPAGVRRQGRVIKAETISYPSCTTEDLAIRLCLRDLRTVNGDVLNGTIPLTYLPPEIQPGSVVIINEPLLGFNNVVMRVSETRIGESDNAEAWVTLSEDKYATTQSVSVAKRNIETLNEAKQVLYRLVTETSYFQGVFATGQTTIDDELDAEPDLGRLIATGVKADGNQLDATLATSTGGDWIDQGLLDFEPYGVLLNDLSAKADETTFLINFNSTLVDINEGDLARIGSEVIRIDQLEVLESGLVEITCGRGCLDGPPTFHKSGTPFIVSVIIEPLPTDFIAGQTINVKMLSRTGSDLLTLSEAETETVTFASRAIRPYPVGDFKIAGSYEPTGTLSGDLVGTWAHRDRTLQTTPAVDDHTAGNIGPENGVVYHPFKRIYSQRNDIFSDTDWFEPIDFFTDYTTPREQFFDDLATPQSVTYDFNADDQDWFAWDDVFAQSDWWENAYTTDTVRVAFGVRVTRGVAPSYDNLHDVYLFGTPLLSPLNFTGSV